MVKIQTPGDSVGIPVALSIGTPFFLKKVEAYAILSEGESSKQAARTNHNAYLPKWADDVSHRR
jgi:hypothetical protein